MGRRTRTVMALISAVIVVIVAAGCGSSSSSSSSAASSSSGSASNAANTSSAGSSSQAQAMVSAAEKTTGVKFPQPTQSFKPGTGKVAVISCGNAGINCLEGSKEVQQAAAAMGWTPSPIFDGQFTPAKQAGYVQQAIQQGYTAIVLVSIDAGSIAAAVQAAAAKHVPVACVMCVTEPQYQKDVVDVSTGGIAEGQELGAWVAANSKPGSTILAYDDKSFPIVHVRRANAEAAIKKYCPTCKVKEADFPTTDLSKPGAPTFSAALAANPPGSLSVVMSPYDPAGITFANAAKQQGRTDFKLTGYDASSEFVNDIMSGTGGAAATTAAPFPYTAWGAMDQVARMHAGLQPWVSNRMPAALVTKDDASQFTGGFFVPKDFDFKSMFLKLWGK